MRDPGSGTAKENQISVANAQESDKVAHHQHTLVMSHFPDNQNLSCDHNTIMPYCLAFFQKFGMPMSPHPLPMLKAIEQESWFNNLKLKPRKCINPTHS